MRLPTPTRWSTTPPWRRRRGWARSRVRVASGTRAPGSATVFTRTASARASRWPGNSVCGHRGWSRATRRWLVPWVSRKERWHSRHDQRRELDVPLSGAGDAPPAAAGPAPLHLPRLLALPGPRRHRPDRGLVAAAVG